MSQAKANRTITLEDFDGATIALDHAIGMLACVAAAADPDNENRPSAELVLAGLDAAAAHVKCARTLIGNGKTADVITFPAGAPR